MKMFRTLNDRVKKRFPLSLLFLLFFSIGYAQKITPVTEKDSTPVVAKTTMNKYDSAMRKHSPRTAAIRSAIFPGLGQIYNKKYWKLPIVYTAIGIPVGLFFNNKTWYDRTRYALAVVASPNPSADSLEAVHSQLRPLVDAKAQGSITRYRNEFRRNMDYSIIFTLLFWGLNIIDATVDAHLKGFDVS